MSFVIDTRLNLVIEGDCICTRIVYNMLRCGCIVDGESEMCAAAADDDYDDDDDCDDGLNNCDESLVQRATKRHAKRL